MKQATKENMQY